MLKWRGLDTILNEGRLFTMSPGKTSQTPRYTGDNVSRHQISIFANQVVYLFLVGSTKSIEEDAGPNQFDREI